MSPIPAGHALLTFVFSGPGAGPGGCVTTMGVSHVSEEFPAVFAEEMYDDFASTIVTHLSSQVQLDECRVRFGTAEGEVVLSHFASTAGSVGGDNEPPSLCWPVVKFTALGGRANRGRMFIPGLFTVATTPTGAISAGTIVSFNVELQNWIDAMELHDAFPVLFHLETGDPPTPITFVSCGNMAYSRGTRLRG